MTQTTREIVHYTWHDHTCPEGPECRVRDLHARSTYDYLPPLDAIAEAVDQAREAHLSRHSVWRCRDPYCRAHGVTVRRLTRLQREVARLRPATKEPEA